MHVNIVCRRMLERAYTIYTIMSIKKKDELSSLTLCNTFGDFLLSWCVANVLGVTLHVIETRSAYDRGNST